MLFVYFFCMCNHRSHLWDYVEARKAFRYTVRFLLSTDCLVLTHQSILLFCFPHFLYFSFLFGYLQSDNKQAPSFVKQDEAGV